MNLHRFTEGDVMHVQFDTPDRPVNTIGPEVLDELDAVVGEIESGLAGPKAIVFTSAKAGTFITGADLFAMRRMDDQQVRDFIERGQRLLQRVADLPVTTVAAINGDCLGGGMELALACDHRVAADDGAISIGLPEVKLGILPGWGGTTRLTRLLGVTRALPLLLTGRMLSPRKARSAGVIDETVAPEALGDAARRLARQSRRRRPAVGEQAIARIGPLRDAVMKRARAKTLETTHGNYPAAEAILDVVEIAVRDGRDAGLAAEREALDRLVKTETCRNLMRLFFLRHEAKRAVRDRLKADPRSVQRAAVVGGGTMGAGIAHALVSAGIDVRLIEIDAKQMSAGLARIRKSLDADVKAGRLSSTQANRAMHRVSPTLDYSGLSRVEFVIEAVVERLEVKREVFAALERAVGEQTVLASNTSSLELGQLAEGMERPDRFIGMHFFNPVAKMPLLEVVRTDHSDDASLATGVELGRRIGKIPVLVGDGPGFLVNRVLIPHLAEAIVLASEGVRIESVDAAMKAWGMPMGPFELLDHVGLDVGVDIFRSLGPRLGGHLPQVPNFEQVVQRGWRGKKNGRGFYLYQPNRWWQRTRSPQPNAELLSLLGASGEPTEVDEPRVTWRLVLPMVNEAARVLEEGVVDSTDVIDLATVLGIGFAPFRGGLARFADTVGLREIVSRLDAHAREHGERFAPTAALRRVADAGQPLQAIADEHARGGAPERGEQLPPRTFDPARHE